jgi:hypothetical protein
MEDHRRDGLISAFRCLAAMEGEDEITRRLLWRNAVKYAGKDREAQGRRGPRASLRALGVPVGVPRDLGVR